jgi:hypothetical protein
MNEGEWRACSNVRLDQPDSEPDKQDAICLLSMFDQLDQFKQGSLTKLQIGMLAQSHDVGPSASAASQRLVANFDRVSHQIAPRDIPVADSIVGRVYLSASRVLSRADLEKIQAETR